jgi:hypothetical protein
MSTHYGTPYGHHRPTFFGWTVRLNVNGSLIEASGPGPHGGYDPENFLLHSFDVKIHGFRGKQGLTHVEGGFTAQGKILPTNNPTLLTFQLSGAFHTNKPL